jgi:hypothetical protein
VTLSSLSLPPSVSCRKLKLLRRRSHTPPKVPSALVLSHLISLTELRMIVLKLDRNLLTPDLTGSSAALHSPVPPSFSHTLLLITHSIRTERIMIVAPKPDEARIIRVCLHAPGLRMTLLGSLRYPWQCCRSTGSHWTVSLTLSLRLMFNTFLLSRIFNSLADIPHLQSRLQSLINIQLFEEYSLEFEEKMMFFLNAGECERVEEARHSSPSSCD